VLPRKASLEIAEILLTGIGIEMVNSPPGDDPKKKWVYRILFLVLGVGVVVTTLLQSSRTAGEQIGERKQRDIEQGKLEGKLDLVSKLLQNSGCPSDAEIGTAVQQGLAKQRYQRARMPIAQGNLATLSSDLLVNMVPSVTKYLRDFRGQGWYSQDRNIELTSYSDYEHERWNKDNPGVWGVGRTQEEWKEERRRTDDSYRPISATAFGCRRIKEGS
jgi:hypothetical protein